MCFPRTKLSPTRINAINEERQRIVKEPVNTQIAVKKFVLILTAARVFWGGGERNTA